MVDIHSGASAQRRIVMVVSGAIAGFSTYALFEYLPDLTDSSQVLTAIITGILSFFLVLLIAIGPLTPVRAVQAALSVALPIAVLMVLVSLRYHSLDSMMDAGHPVVAGATLLFVATPFVLGLFDPDTQWRDYATLFSRAWEIVVRYVAAGLFTGVFWGLYLLSGAILELVGIEILSDFLEIDPVPLVLTGGVLGLGLAVVFELRHLISPKIVLRLLRLLLPPLAVVSIIFALVAPVRGLSDLLGSLSAGATVMAMAIALITLVTVTLDRNDDEAARAKALTLSAKAGAVLALLLAALSLWAITLRVGQYGWTPNRVLAATTGVVLLGYGLFYTAALLRPAWQAAIRRANVVMALATLAIAALWLTPVLNAERLSAHSQLARFEAGKLDAEALDLWRISEDWGKPGQRALTPYRAADHPMHDALADRIAALDAGKLDPYQPAQTVPTLDEVGGLLKTVLAIRPEGRDANALINRLPDYQIRQIQSDCAAFTTPSGAPACVGVVADFHGTPEDELLVVHWNGSALRVTSTHGAYIDGPNEMSTETAGPDVIDAILNGDFDLVPARGLELKVGDVHAAPMHARE